MFQHREKQLVVKENLKITAVVSFQSNLFKLYHVRLHEIKIYRIPNVFDFMEEVNNSGVCGVELVICT